MTMGEVVHIDGSEGEGGGQILRTALSLAAITGRPLVIDAIRAKRRKPGLLRQHLVAASAAAAVCGAEVEGAELGASRLVLRPGSIRGGAYRFAIGSAGSTCLVAQTVLPILLHAREPSEVVFEGGTHNDQAPTFDFLREVYLPLLRRMGAGVEASLERHGFYPAGGGVLRLRVRPSRLEPLELVEAGALRAIRAEAIFANLPHHVAARELAVVRDAFDLPPEHLSPREVRSPGPGNVLSLVVERDTTELVAAFGRRGVRAEAVAAAAVAEAKQLLAAEVPVGPHLADQLLLPLALAGRGTIRTLEPTMHTRTNAAVIERFLGVSVAFTEERPGVARARVR
jgi:RNA 3'-terminal phosphate cyclase (ATP)